jgi:hypothetical protein
MAKVSVYPYNSLCTRKAFGKPKFGSVGLGTYNKFFVVIQEYYMAHVVIQRGGFCIITSQGGY